MKIDKEKIEANMAHQMDNMNKNPDLLRANLERINKLPKKQRKMIKKLLPKEFQAEFDRI